ncbi:hypothetical protein KSF78_0002824 [Schistosoma japonicum]|nr:hypothetical protein KSF78_0002824 [Schistosoma japonicum]
MEVENYIYNQFKQCHLEERKIYFRKELVLLYTCSFDNIALHIIELPTCKYGLKHINRIRKCMCCIYD